MSQKAKIKPQTLGQVIQAAATTETTWLVDGLLLDSGASLISGKPKIGKSTLVRQIALAVARGEPVLGRAVGKGKVLYLAGEEHPARVGEHFIALGAKPEDHESILIHTDAIQENALGVVSDLIDEYQPRLVIVDPLFRYVRELGSITEYASVTLAFEKVIHLARQKKVHLLCVHHQTKAHGDAQDGILGSQAIAGAFDTLIAIDKGKNTGERVLDVRQRYGGEHPRRMLEFDRTRQMFVQGSTVDEVTERTIQERIVAFLEHTESDATEEEIMRDVTGKTEQIRPALRGLVADGRVRRAGRGVKGSPFVYKLNSDLEAAKSEQSLEDNASGKNTTLGEAENVVQAVVLCGC